MKTYQRPPVIKAHVCNVATLVHVKPVPVIYKRAKSNGYCIRKQEVLRG